MQLLEIGTRDILLDLADDGINILDFSPRFIDAGSQRYRRGDRELVSNNSPTFKAELTFEFQHLTQAEVDTLKAIYRGREHFICVPDPVDEPEKVYIVRWVSGFDRQDTVITNWTQGRNLQTVFREV